MDEDDDKDEDIEDHQDWETHDKDQDENEGGPEEITRLGKLVDIKLRQMMIANPSQNKVETSSNRLSHLSKQKSKAGNKGC